MKETYAVIEFTNCGTDYDRTICPWSEVNEYVELLKNEAVEYDEEGYKIATERGYLPEIKISTTLMTSAEYGEWFDKHVKP